jgi:Mn2+/Fe2+ NRAMP family transporter
MPFLAGTLLYMNNQQEKMGRLKNGFWANSALALSLVLFAYLGWLKLYTEVFKG